MKNKPLISIITINYKQSKVTNLLITSLQQIGRNDFEIVIVDNNSGNDVSNINTNYSNVVLIKNSKNLGFAGGNNTGIKVAKGKYILLLNNDTEAKNDFIEPMIKLFRSDKSIGAISPKIKFFNQPGIIQYAGFSKMNPFTLRMNAVGSHQIDDGKYTKVYETNFAHGCALMVTRDVINKVGLLPEAYFLYYEEHDWSTRIKKFGYKIFYQGHSEIYHKESISVKKDSPLKTYYLNRNRILYMKRNLGLINKVISSIYLLVISIPKNILMYIFRREKKHLIAYMKAIAWNMNITRHSS